eukprot:scaffold6712_cov214-Alexandrium_tamarense.AAC.1
MEDERVITKEAFVDWYVDWLFGDGDSDEEESDEEENTSEDSTTTAAAAAKPSDGEGWGSMFKASEE